jgi:hypothetical protein
MSTADSFRGEVMHILQRLSEYVSAVPSIELAVRNHQTVIIGT